MQSAQLKDFKVAIIGGGMGGLALAVGLIRGGIKVDIFEQAPKFEEIGAGVGIGANGIRALRSLGILDAVLQRAEEPLGLRAFLFLSGLPGHEVIYDYPALDSDMAIAVHRAHFLDTLVNLVPPEVAHFDKKCTSVSQSSSSGVTITFEDNTTHTADLVIGCDGIKSAIREVVVGKRADPKFTRTVAYRGLIPEKDALTAANEIVIRRPLAFLGPDGHIIVFPIKGKNLTNIVVFSTDRSKPAEEQAPPPGPWVVPSTQAEMLSHYEGWGPKVLNLLSHIKNPSKWFLHSQEPPLESYVRGKVALLGDAAHSMLPHLGAGAGQAMEDALLLSQLLTHPLTNTSNLEPVLEAYDLLRRPRANRVLKASYAAGEVYERVDCSFEKIRQDLAGIWEFVWHHDLDDDFRAAVAYLEERQVFKAGPSN
ncbi:FAD/NAD(P)-binding domain-containing protein [Ramaria rubella]|nr:FAD/NAD(P)-binding domain-containing protein [Ramaria rubella]